MRMFHEQKLIGDETFLATRDEVKLQGIGLGKPDPPEVANVALTH
jgi:hypothetical protein